MHVPLPSEAMLCLFASFLVVLGFRRRRRASTEHAVRQHCKTDVSSQVNRDDVRLLFLVRDMQSCFSSGSSLPELLEKKRLIDMHTNIATAMLSHIKVSRGVCREFKHINATCISSAATEARRVFRHRGEADEQELVGQQHHGHHLEPGR